MSPALERNLALIRWHEAVVSAAPYAAVFVLFTRGEFGLDRAIALAGIYYAAVVVLEVPSGWMSDRLGRVLTLRVTAIAWVGCYTCYLLGTDRFYLVMIGQVLLAVGYSHLSGTDVSFHYESLEGLDREDEYADRQAVVSSNGLVFKALGAIVGGGLGLIDLRLPFAAAMILALIQVVITFQFTEPTHATRSTGNFGSQIVSCLRYLRNGPLAWIFAYGIAMVVLEHVAHTLMQPWLTAMLGRSPDELGATPIVAGVVVAVTALIGARFARLAPSLSRRFGLRRVLVGLGVLSALIVTAMAASTLPVVLMLVVMRSVQGAVGPILISAAVAPHVSSEHRATFLSLDSLSGRLTYSSLLLLVSTDVDQDLPRALAQLSVASWVAVAVIGAWAVVVWRRHGPAEVH